MGIRPFKDTLYINIWSLGSINHRIPSMDIFLELVAVMEL